MTTIICISDRATWSDSENKLLLYFLQSNHLLEDQVEVCRFSGPSLSNPKTIGGTASALRAVVVLLDLRMLPGVLEWFSREMESFGIPVAKVIRDHYGHLCGYEVKTAANT